MSCPGAGHCAGCAGGGGVPVLAFAWLYGAAWIAEHLVEVVATSAACGVLAVAVVVAITRATARREAMFATQLAARRPIMLTATAAPQVGKGTTVPAIENHYHVHFDPADREAVRIIHAALPGMAGDVITEE